MVDGGGVDDEGDGVAGGEDEDEDEDEDEEGEGLLLFGGVRQPAFFVGPQV